MKILLLSAYNALSHKNWCHGLMSNIPQYDWTMLTLSPNNFPWRIRGNPLSWLATENKTLVQKYDVVIATSMVDLATLCGIFPNLANAHKIIYFHENQFAYPLSNQIKNGNLKSLRIEPLMVNLYGAFAADKVVFNTNFNRTSFIENSKKFLKKMPDKSPLSCIDIIEKKSSILPVPIKEYLQQKTTNKPIPNSIIWNHRWEYDKNPKDFFDACYLLKKWNIPFKLIVMGQQFKNSPSEFHKAKEILENEIICWGEQPSDEYHKWLSKGKYVVSTAIHEFQGVAIMEASQAGCIPVIPDRLSYPEIFNKKHLFGQTPEELALFLKKQMTNDSLEPQNLDGYSWNAMKNDYVNLIEN